MLIFSIFALLYCVEKIVLLCHNYPLLPVYSDPDCQQTKCTFLLGTAPYLSFYAILWFLHQWTIEYFFRVGSSRSSLS